MTNPRYQGIENKTYPRVSIGEDEKFKIITGEISGVKGPCQTFSEVTIFELNLLNVRNHQN
jgi:redox-sensitive bicupin YhaK (pirin superfamily)